MRFWGAFGSRLNCVSDVNYPTTSDESEIIRTSSFQNVDVRFLGRTARSRRISLVFVKFLNESPVDRLLRSHNPEKNPKTKNGERRLEQRLRLQNCNPRRQRGRFLETRAGIFSKKFQSYFLLNRKISPILTKQRNTCGS